MLAQSRKHGTNAGNMARTKVLLNSGIGITNLDDRKPCVFESQVHVFD
ncbi:hypothetical protein Spb1_31470 [Planctopirus ephydatiae]|uniref:Uncharacterized protein n=1 Tax=Planctopirus ephydatiae TaxID=2528019 RepID=A0A518GRI8_9PLAN|nr:hypothetical protein [Planctopirus ephydatiae]QDV31204.1 hypothetical protein Spb1_31470 [Planctopirus ephydatiae]